MAKIKHAEIYHAKKRTRKFPDLRYISPSSSVAEVSECMAEFVQGFHEVLCSWSQEEFQSHVSLCRSSSDTLDWLNVVKFASGSFTVISISAHT